MSTYSCPECENFATDDVDAMSDHLYYECPITMADDRDEPLLLPGERLLTVEELAVARAEGRSL